MDLRTFEQYEQQAVAFDLPCATTGKLWYYALGLSGEVAELTEKMNPPSNALSIGFEMGDVLWYVSRLRYLCEVDVIAPPMGKWHPCPGQDVTRHAIALVIEVGRVTEAIKKHYRDETDLNGPFLTERFGQILWRLAHLAGHYGFTLGEIAELNVDKLMKRLQRGTVIGSTGDHR